MTDNPILTTMLALNVGDSFAIPLGSEVRTNDELRAFTGHIFAIARAVKSRKTESEDFKITTRRLIENKQRVLRIWRIR